MISRIALNVAWSPSDAQIVPVRWNSQPRANATGIRPTKAASATPTAWLASMPEIVRTWTTAKNSAPRPTPRKRPIPRIQAVVAKPRNMISSLIGATTAPASRLTMNPGVSPAGGSGLSRAVRRERGAERRTPDWRRDARDDRRHRDRGDDHRQRRQRSDPHVAKGRQPLSDDAHRLPRQRAAVDHEQPDQTDVDDGLDEHRGEAPDRTVHVDPEESEYHARQDQQDTGDRDPGEEHEEWRRTRVRQDAARPSLDGLTAGAGDETDREDDQPADQEQRPDDGRPGHDAEDDRTESCQGREPAENEEAGRGSAFDREGRRA